MALARLPQPATRYPTAARRARIRRRTRVASSRRTTTRLLDGRGTSRHPTPIGGGGMGAQARAEPPRARAAAKKKARTVAGNTSLDDETTFQNPFPDTARPSRRRRRPGGSPATSPRCGGSSATTTSTRWTRPAALQLQPRRGRLPAVDQVQEAAGPRRVDVQARLDVLQAAALRDERPPVRRPAPVHRRR